MEPIFKLLVVIMIGGWLGVYGTLLASRPGAFLKFHDAFFDRRRLHKNAKWRKNVHNAHYKILGFVDLSLGLLLVLLAVKKLILIAIGP
jgi:uncharacterized membrane protein